MNRTETAALLTLMAAYDRRTLGEEDVLAWHELLSGVEFEDAKTVVLDHYRASSQWLDCASVLAGVKQLRSARLAGVEQIVPGADPDDVPAYLAETRAIRAQAASGEREVPEPLPAKPLPSVEPGLSSLGQSLAGLRLAREVS